ncbi:MAG: hypothetical protein AAB309_01620 [Deltaproteobacteria bacterium]
MKYFLSIIFTVLLFATSNIVFGYAIDCKGGRVTDLTENSDGTATLESDDSQVRLFLTEYALDGRPSADDFFLYRKDGEREPTTDSALQQVTYLRKDDAKAYDYDAYDQLWKFETKKVYVYEVLPQDQTHVIKVEWVLLKGLSGSADNPVTISRVYFKGSETPVRYVSWCRKVR